MRYLSEDTKAKIIDFVDGYYADNGYTPTIAEIATGIRMSDGTVHKYLHRMDEAGELSFDGRHIVTHRIAEVQEERGARISGDIACGAPMYAEEQYGDRIVLPDRIARNGEHFILRANGHSMINADIDDSDFVVIRKQNYADEGEIIAALVDGDSATLKTFTLDPQNKKIVLVAENDDKKTYPNIVREEIRIMGVAVYVIKKLRRR